MDPLFTRNNNLPYILATNVWHGDQSVGHVNILGLGRRSSIVTSIGCPDSEIVTPRLPQELIDQIIDELSTDLTELKTCSLVASAWAHRCRPYLFRTVSLFPCRYTVTEDRYSSRNLAPYVRRLRVFCGDRDEDELPVPRDNELTVSLLSCFPNVSQLEMHNMRWDNLRPEVRQYFLTGMKTITAMSMWDVKFHSFDDLLRLIHAFPYLNTLHLRQVQWDVDAEWTFSSDHVMQVGSRGIPELRELMVYEAPSSSWFLSSLFHGHDTTCKRELRRIGLDWGDGQDDDLSILSNLVRASNSLHTFELDLSWHAPLVPLDLSHNPHLRGIWLDGLLLDSPSSPTSLKKTWLPSLISSIVSPHVIQIVFYIFLGDTDGIRLLDLERIDWTLSGPRFAELQNLGFIVTILPHPAWGLPSRAEVQGIIKKRMPIANARDILRFQTEDLLRTV